MSDIDKVIREFADVHGYKNIDDKGIREVRSTLSNNFLDNMLDSSVSTEKPSSSEESHNDDGKKECS